MAVTILEVQRAMFTGAVCNTELCCEPICIVVFKVTSRSFFDVVHTATYAILCYVTESHVCGCAISIQKQTWVHRVTFKLGNSCESNTGWIKGASCITGTEYRYTNVLETLAVKTTQV